MVEVNEKGLHWRERPSDGGWYAKGSGGQYQLVPRRDAPGFRTWFLGNDGEHVDLGTHDTFGAATAAAARYQPGQGLAAEAGEDCGCPHSEPPCEHKKKKETAIAIVAGEDGGRAPVVYEDSQSSASPKTLRWHRSKKGYVAKGRMGEYEIVHRKADRRHGVLPVVLLLNAGNASTLNQFDSIAEAKAWAQKYEEMAPHFHRARVQEVKHAAEEPTPNAALLPTSAAESDPPLVTLQRNFKQYKACSTAAAKIGPIDGPKQIWALLGSSMNKESQEIFVVIPLNIHGKLSDCPIEVARGARSRVEVDPSIVLQAALAANADSFAVSHNHPGSRPDPSQADRALTKVIENATKALGGSLEFQDHYIVSEKGVYSIKDNRLWKASR
jgi:hypothetical protein